MLKRYWWVLAAVAAVLWWAWKNGKLPAAVARVLPDTPVSGDLAGYRVMVAAEKADRASASVAATFASHPVLSLADMLGHVADGLSRAVGAGVVFAEGSAEAIAARLFRQEVGREPLAEDVQYYAGMVRALDVEGTRVRMRAMIDSGAYSL